MGGDRLMVGTGRKDIVKKERLREDSMCNNYCMLKTFKYL